MEMEFQLEEERNLKKNDINNSDKVLELADRICIFCPMINKGIMFYDQSPTGVVAKFSGSLPKGKFWSSGEQFVEWDESINGNQHESIPANDFVSFHVKTTRIRTSTGNDVDSFKIDTIIVSEKNFIKLLYQIDHPTMHPDNGYKVLDVNSEIYEYDYYKNNFNDINTFDSNSNFKK